MIEFTVLGIPGPQGSKRHVGGGRMIESSKKVKPWREAVKWAAFEAMERFAERKGVGVAFDGPVRLRIVFTLPAPKGLAKKKAHPHTKKPDLSKLVRSTEDAITDSGLWKDDAQVVQMEVAKTYPDYVIGSHVGALPSPGARIFVEPLCPQTGVTCA